MSATKELTLSESFSNYQKWIIALLAITQFTVVLDFTVMSPMGDILMKTLNISTKQFGFVVSCYAFSAGISGLLTAGFADKFDRKKILLFFYSGFILGTLGCALAPDYHWLVLARIVTGLFGGVIGSVSMAIITDIFTLNQRGRVIGIVQMGFSASQVLGIPVGIYFANLWGWHSSFLLLFFISILIALLIISKMEAVDKHLLIQSDYNFFQHFQQVIFNRNYLIAFSATALLSIGAFLIMPFGSAFAVNNLHVSQNNLPLIFLFTGLASLIIMPLVGRLADKYNKFVIFAIGSAWTMAMIIIYTNQSPIPLWLVILLNIILFMGIMSRAIPASALTSAIPNPADRGAYMSINSSLQQIAGGIASAAAGLIVYQQTSTSPLENYPTLGYVVSIIMVVCLFLMYQVNKMISN
ncbi:MAG: MFS transporter [Bacteroidales bacterium]